MSFDPETFLSTEHTEAGSTEYILVPEGQYPAICIGEKIAARKIQVDGEDRIVVDVPWEISDPEVAEVTHRAKNIVRQGIFLDMTPSGNIDWAPGCNVPLGRLREAVEQNRADRPWNFHMLGGCAVLVTVEHKLGSDAEGRKYANVTAVAKLT